MNWLYLRIYIILKKKLKNWRSKEKLKTVNLELKSYFFDCKSSINLWLGNYKAVWHNRISEFEFSDIKVNIPLELTVFRAKCFPLWWIQDQESYHEKFFMKEKQSF